MMPPEAVQLDHEFFSAVAGIAGTLWAVMAVSLTLITGSIRRLELLRWAELPIVGGTVVAVILTISNFFLCGMFFALGHLLPGPRGHLWVSFISLYSLLIGFGMCGAVLARQEKEKKVSAPSWSFVRENISLLVVYGICAVFIIAMPLAAEYLPAVIYVVLTIALGSMAMLGLGILWVTLEIVGIGKTTVNSEQNDGLGET